MLNIEKFKVDFFNQMSLMFDELVKKYDVNTIPSVNKYMYDVPKLVYNPANKRHLLITNSSQLALLNSGDYDNYFIAPGVYPAIQIKTSGSKSNYKTLSLYNNSDLHPGKLKENERVSIPISFVNSNFWILDRLGTINHSDKVNNVSYKVYPTCSNIIFNEFFLTNFCRAFEIQSNTSLTYYTKDIFIQNCRIEKMNPAAIDNDDSAIMLVGSESTKFRKIENVRIVNNEIVNCNDGIQTMRYVGTQLHDANYDGLIIDNNHIYVDEYVYTDGNGKLNPSGKFSLTENAIDLKAGSSDVNNPIVISNNKLWGFRKTDIVNGGSGDAGYAIVGHYDTKNVIIEDNYIFNSTNGIGFRDPSNVNYSCENVTIRSNKLSNIAELDQAGKALTFHTVKNMLVEKNIISNNTARIWLELYKNDKNAVKITDTLLSNMLPMIGEAGQADIINTINLAQGELKDLLFTTDNFTNNPKQIRIENIILTE